MTAEVESGEFYASNTDETKTSSNVKNNLTDILGEGNNATYPVITSNGLVSVKLKKILKRDSLTDTDKDGISDWNEVNVEIIEEISSLNSNTKTLRYDDLPTLGACLDRFSKYGYVYVEEGFNQLMSNESMHTVLNYPILPICSDPTKVDSDGDGFLDNAYANNYDNVDEENKVTYEWVKQSDEYFNVSDPNPLKKEIVWQWPAYYSDGTYINRLQSSFGEGREGYEHNGIDITPKAGKKDNCKAVASYAGTIQLMKENSATAGNYIEIKHVINGKIYISRYLHLKEFNQSIYEQYTLGKTVNVNAGDIIGIIGDTASPGAVHLHYTLCKEKVDTKIDPLCFDIDVSGELITNPDLMFMKLPIGLRKTCDNRCDSCNKYFKKLETRYKLDETDWGDLN